MFGYFEYYFGYIWILIPGILLGFWAQMKVQSTYSKYSRMENKRGITGAQTAKYILEGYGIDIPVERIGGTLTDHYDPSSKVLRLSAGVYDGTDVAALGVAAHEVGHAIQHSRGYAPLSIRNGFYPLCAIGDQFGPYLVLLGIMIGGMGGISYYVMMAGIILFAFAVFFSLVTLPVEFDASNRAIKILDDVYNHRELRIRYNYTSIILSDNNQILLNKYLDYNQKIGLSIKNIKGIKQFISRFLKYLEDNKIEIRTINILNINEYLLSFKSISKISLIKLKILLKLYLSSELL